MCRLRGGQHLSPSTNSTPTRYTYDSWGNPTTAAGPLATINQYRYATGYTDNQTGLTKMGARYYNPTTGRFTQTDPSGKDQHYMYGGNNPITNNDPTGLYGWSNLGAQLGGWGGGIVAGSIVALACAGSFGVGCLAAGLVLGGAAPVLGLARRSLVEPTTRTETPQLGVQSRADFRVVFSDS